MEIKNLRGTLLIGIFLQAAVGRNEYTDFLISEFCPDAWKSLAKKTIDCGPDAVIDIIWARVALLTRRSLCVLSFDDMVADIIRDTSLHCTTDLPFVLCHGNQICAVDGSMANETLPECDHNLGPAVHHSNTLYVRYRCLKFENRIQLPSTQVVKGSVIDILSPNFSDNSSPAVQDLFCKISPIADTENVSFLIDIKLANYPTRMSSVATVELEKPGEDTVKLIPFNGTYQIRNKIYKVFGKKWILRYRGEKEKFWIQIKAAPTNTSDIVQLNVYCESEAPPTKGAKEQTKNSVDKYLIIGTSGGLMFIILILIVVTVYCWRRKRRPNKETSKLWAEPAPASTGNVNDYATASAIDEEPNQNKESQQQNSYVNASPDIAYSSVNKDNRSDKNVNDDETMMFENNTLYSSAGEKHDNGPITGQDNEQK